MKESFASLIKSFNLKGHSPATSGNYSFFDRDKDTIVISESGVDKEYFEANNLLEISIDGSMKPGFEGRKSSAETALHLEIYKRTNANCVLHSHHMVFNTFPIKSDELSFSNHEILKAIHGINTHQTEIIVPVHKNTQDIETLASIIFNNVIIFPAHAFLIENHGLTVWGQTVAEAKRHLEAYQYLFQYEQQKVIK